MKTQNNMISMKKTIWFILPIISLLVFGSIYLVYDSKGFDYGLGCNICNKKMPYNLKPHNGSEFSFSLKDEDDFELVGVGFRYQTTVFKIKKILGYGYNDSSVVVKCTDSLDTIKYLISYETGYKSKNGSFEISFKDLIYNDFEQIKNKYKWFEVDNEKNYMVDRNKFLSAFGAFFSLILIVGNVFKLVINRFKKR